MRLYDAHNHLQDERLGAFETDIRARTESATCMVVNGSCEADWPAVLELARNRPNVLPSFGYHPWYVGERSADWKNVLLSYLDAFPSAVGEIGLDRWIDGFDISAQKEVFEAQMAIAAERNLPVSIHCLRAWGLLEASLRAGPRPACGFVLHSYGGPVEMVETFAKMGAYFSLPGAFAQESKHRNRESFLHVPADRLLVETDAPDQCLPEALDNFRITDPATGKRLNHPANLESVYRFAAELLQLPLSSLVDQVEQNFLKLFGKVRSA